MHGLPFPSFLGHSHFTRQKSPSWHGTELSSAKKRHPTKAHLPNKQQHSLALANLIIFKNKVLYMSRLSEPTPKNPKFSKSSFSRPQTLPISHSSGDGQTDVGHAMLAAKWLEPSPTCCFDGHRPPMAMGSVTLAGSGGRTGGNGSPSSSHCWRRSLCVGRRLTAVQNGGAGGGMDRRRRGDGLRRSIHQQPSAHGLPSHSIRPPSPIATVKCPVLCCPPSATGCY